MLTKIFHIGSGLITKTWNRLNEFDDMTQSLMSHFSKHISKRLTVENHEVALFGHTSDRNLLFFVSYQRVLAKARIHSGFFVWGEPLHFFQKDAMFAAILDTVVFKRDFLRLDDCLSDVDVEGTQDVLFQFVEVAFLGCQPVGILIYLSIHTSKSPIDCFRELAPNLRGWRTMQSRVLNDNTFFLLAFELLLRPSFILPLRGSKLR